MVQKLDAIGIRVNATSVKDQNISFRGWGHVKQRLEEGFHDIRTKGEPNLGWYSGTSSRTQQHVRVV